MPYGEGGRFVSGFAGRALSGAATTQSPEVDPGQVALNVAVAVNVTATGGAGPSLALSVQWSNDGTNWYTADPADSFTAITAVSKVVKSFASKGKYLRLNEALTGTTPSVTYSVEAWTL
jgi:hypothetical protein